MVLHNIANDTKLVKVSSSAFRPKWFLESNLNVIDMVPVPGSTQERVSKTQDQNILDHLLAQVVVDAEQLILFPIRLEGLLELAGASEVFAEGLLNL